MVSIDSVSKYVREIVGKGFKTIIVMGKGGVGKTTVSILLGYLLSQEGRVLVASMDPAKHLQEYLGLKSTGRIEKIDDRLYGAQYDIDKYSKRVADEFAVTLKRVMPGLTALNLDKVVGIVKEAPGFEEEVFLRILAELYDLANDYDYVVVDTPPTGVSLRVLLLPKLYLTWIKGLKELRETIVSVKYAIARTLGEEVEPRDPVLEKLAELENKYAGLLDKLRGDTTVYVAIATPEPLPVYEVKMIAAKLEYLGARPNMIVVNRVLGEKAQLIGVRDVEAKAIKDLEEIRCRYNAAGLLIKHAGFTPRSLRDVVAIAEKGLVEILPSC